MHIYSLGHVLKMSVSESLSSGHDSDSLPMRRPNIFGSLQRSESALGNLRGQVPKYHEMRSQKEVQVFPNFRIFIGDLIPLFGYVPLVAKDKKYLVDEDGAIRSVKNLKPGVHFSRASEVQPVGSLGLLGSLGSSVRIPAPQTDGRGGGGEATMSTRWWSRPASSAVVLRPSARLFSGILWFCFWAPIILPIKPNKYFFFPQG